MINQALRRPSIAVLAAEHAEHTPSASSAIDLNALPVTADLDVGVHTLRVFVEVQDPDTPLVEGSVRLLYDPIDSESAYVRQQRFESLERYLLRSRHAIKDRISATSRAAPNADSYGRMTHISRVPNS